MVPRGARPAGGDAAISGRFPEPFEAVQHQVQRELELELIVWRASRDGVRSIEKPPARTVASGAMWPGRSRR
jgi:hypothetical protein